MLDPVAVDGRTVIAAGATGHGTLLLAGHAGNSGHEGDLTLRLDVIPTVDNRQMVFADQRLRINGKNKKIMSGVLGVIPYAGFGARFIRGQAVVIEPISRSRRSSIATRRRSMRCRHRCPHPRRSANARRW